MTNVVFPAFPPVILFLLIKKIKILRVIYDVIVWEKPKTQPLKSRFYMKVLDDVFMNKYMHIFTVSEYSKEKISNIFNFDKSKITVTYNGVPEVFKSESEKILKDKVILSVGTIEPRKNYEFLIEIFAKNQESFSGYKLIICGRKGWGYEELMGSIKKYRNFEIEIITDASDKDLKDFYKKSEIFIYPSTYEGFGIPLIEAFSNECLVIAANNSAITEVVNTAGILVDGYNIDNWVKNLKDLIELPIERKKEIILKGKNNIKIFSWENSAEKIMESIGHEN